MLVTSKVVKIIHCQWNFFILFLTSYSLDLFSLTYIQPDIYSPRSFYDPPWLPALLLLGTSPAPTAPWQRGMERRWQCRSLHSVLPNIPWPAVVLLLSCLWQKMVPEVGFDPMPPRVSDTWHHECLLRVNLDTELSMRPKGAQPLVCVVCSFPAQLIMSCLFF